MPSSPLQPGQLAVLFDNAAETGATIGHYVTVVGVKPASRAEFPAEPERWRYQIYLAHLDQYREAALDELLAVPASANDVDASGWRPFEVQLPSINGDEERIVGRYRLGRRPWEVLVVEKRSQSVATYELRGQVVGASLFGGDLHYYVPRDTRLDRTYILRALSELFHVTNLEVAKTPSSKQPPAGATKPPPIQASSLSWQHYVAIACVLLVLLAFIPVFYVGVLALVSFLFAIGWSALRHRHPGWLAGLAFVLIWLLLPVWVSIALAVFQWWAERP